jgi:hypothetical protein
MHLMAKLAGILGSGQDFTQHGVGVAAFARAPFDSKDHRFAP